MSRTIFASVNYLTSTLVKELPRVGLFASQIKTDMFGGRELSFAVVALRVSFKLPERRILAGLFCQRGSLGWLTCMTEPSESGRNSPYASRSCRIALQILCILPFIYSMF